MKNGNCRIIQQKAANKNGNANINREMRNRNNEIINRKWEIRKGT